MLFTVLRTCSILIGGMSTKAAMFKRGKVIRIMNRLEVKKHIGAGNIIPGNLPEKSLPLPEVKAKPELKIIIGGKVKVAIDGAVEFGEVIRVNKNSIRVMLDGDMEEKTFPTHTVQAIAQGA